MITNLPDEVRDRIIKALQLSVYAFEVQKQIVKIIRGGDIYPPVYESAQELKLRMILNAFEQKQDAFAMILMEKFEKELKDEEGLKNKRNYQ